MKRRTVVSTALIAVGAAAALTLTSAQATPPHADITVFVRSQNLFYSSFITTTLPPNGRFQLLEMGPNGLETDFGPGDPGYLGGRWQADLDGDGTLEYFSCPLLPPGRPNP